MSNADKVNFDRIARPYRWLEYVTLGRALERCRMHYVPELLGTTRALVLGDGDGRFLAELLRNHPQIKADAVDTSAAMLQLLRRRCERVASDAATRLNTHQIDALNFIPAQAAQYDLVVTHFFLDCLTQAELEALVARIAPSLTPHALWLVSDFRIPDGAMRLPARTLVRLLYLAFRLLTNLRTTRLPDHATPLTRAGLSCIAHHRQMAGILATELWQTTVKQGSRVKKTSLPDRTDDPLPNPEPAVPSLDNPDPEVFCRNRVSPREQAAFGPSGLECE